MHAAVKRAWHRDLVAHPRLHAWVLNLYRAGELYPTTVTDYFPVAHAPWPWLAQAMTTHAQDEARHGRIFERLIADEGGVVRDDLHGPDVYNHVIRNQTAHPFSIQPQHTADEKRQRVGHFLAHAHCLEVRVLRSLELHHNACAQAGKRRASRLLETIMTDEARHVSYTRATLDELLPQAQVRTVLRAHQAAEARANLLFSARQVRQCLTALGALLPSERRLVYRAGALVQEAWAHV